MLPKNTLARSLRAGRRVAPREHTCTTRGSRRRAGREGAAGLLLGGRPSLRELVVSSISLDPSIAVHVVRRLLAGQHPAAREDRQSAVKSGGKYENNPSPCPWLLRAHWYSVWHFYNTPSHYCSNNRWWEQVFLQVPWRDGSTTKARWGRGGRQTDRAKGRTG
jgi:hypothetical protein